MEYFIIVLCVITIILTLVYFKIKNISEELDLCNEKINESIKNIDLYLEKKEEYLERALNIINNSNKKKYGKKNIMESLIINKNKKLDMETMYKELNDNLLELKELVDDDPKLKELKKLNETMYDLNNNESDLISSITFYNNSIDSFKKIKKNIFSNMIIKGKNFNNYKFINIDNEKKEI